MHSGVCNGNHFSPKPIGRVLFWDCKHTHTQTPPHWRSIELFNQAQLVRNEFSDIPLTPMLEHLATARRMSIIGVQWSFPARHIHSCIITSGCGRTCCQSIQVIRTATSVWSVLHRIRLAGNLRSAMISWAIMSTAFNWVCMYMVIVDRWCVGVPPLALTTQSPMMDYMCFSINCLSTLSTFPFPKHIFALWIPFNYSILM